MENLETCKKYVREFLEQEYAKMDLRKQLDKFKNYNFSQIALQENCHEDSTKLAKSIYFIIWHNILPNLKNFNDIGMIYGGETMNTFNTLFQEELNGINLYIPEKENTSFYKKIKNFRIKYLTIGNFMLLPTFSSNGSSINQRKGSYRNKYKDYFDLFVYYLYQTNEFDDLKAVNKFYFDEMNDIKNFYTKNFLEDYFENDKPKILFKHYYEKSENKYYPYYWWQWPDEHKASHKDEYVIFAEDYIDQATKIIEKRAKIMCDILYEKLK